MFMHFLLGVANIDWYVLRTLSGKEDAVFMYFKRILSEFPIIYPKRRIGWRKNGGVISIIRPLPALTIERDVLEMGCEIISKSIRNAMKFIKKEFVVS